LNSGQDEQQQPFVKRFWRFARAGNIFEHPYV
jgi:hypothetical protein